MSRLFRKCGSLDISKSYGHPWPVTGIALLLTFTVEMASDIRTKFHADRFRNSSNINSSLFVYMDRIAVSNLDGNICIQSRYIYVTGCLNAILCIILRS
jgi:hypothetical protein